MIKEYKSEQRPLTSRSKDTTETTGRGQGNRLITCEALLCEESEQILGDWSSQNKHGSVYHTRIQPCTENKERVAKPQELGPETILFEY